MQSNAPMPPTGGTVRKHEFLMMDAVLASTLLFLPNLFLFFFFMPSHAALPATGLQPVREILAAQAFNHMLMGAGLNLLFLGLLIWLRQYIVMPMLRSLPHLQAARYAMAQEAMVTRPGSYFNFRLFAGDIVRFTFMAQEHYRKYQELGKALEDTRQKMRETLEQNRHMLDSAAHEISSQYKAVITYAHYLDEHIEQRRGDPQLRFDFDDVCESSFYLRLMAGAMHLLYRSSPIIMAPVSLAQLMQDTLLALSPALDRRAMKLTSSEVQLEVVATSDHATLTHVLWMMLLGLVRYASDESTLRLRCFRSQDGLHAWLSIVISELSPGQMTPDERAAHFARQLNSTTPHLFAETIRAHASLQLAELLLARVEGQIDVLPLTPTTCEISLILPSIQNSTAQSL